MSPEKEVRDDIIRRASAATDFLEGVSEMLAPDTPSDCPCGRSYNEHVQDYIIGCQGIRQMVDENNYIPLADLLRERGKHFLGNCLDFLYPEGEMLYQIGLISLCLMHNVMINIEQSPQEAVERLAGEIIARAG